MTDDPTMVAGEPAEGESSEISKTTGASGEGEENPRTTAGFDRAFFGGLGVGLLVAAASLALVRWLGHENGPESDRQVEIGMIAAVIVVAALVMLTVSVVALVRDGTGRGSGRVRLLTTLLGVVVLSPALVAMFGQFVTDEKAETDPGEPTLGSLWLLLVGCACTFVAWYPRWRPPPEDGVRRRRAVAIAAGVVPVLVVAATSFPKSTVAEPRPEIAIEHVDMHAVPGETPARVGAEPEKLASGEKPALDEELRGEALSVGPGYFTGDFMMINGDTGTVRWRLTEPDDTELIAVVDARTSTVAVTARRGGAGRTFGVDAYSGEVRWTRDIALARWSYGGDWTRDRAVAANVLVVVSDDARTARAFAPDSGHPIWTRDVGRDCAIREITATAAVAVRVHCVPDDESGFWILDPATGRRTAVHPVSAEGFAMREDTALVADRYVPLFSRNDPDEVVGVADAATGEPVVRFAMRGAGADGHADQSIVGCAADGDCLIKKNDADGSEGRIVSLRRAHPDIPIKTIADGLPGPLGLRGRMLWLREQLLWAAWPHHAVVIVNRRTGEVTHLDGVHGDLLAVPGAVLVRGESELVRLAGA
ncbi:MAG: PQQ-binding-like beta-propeller repeat protein [Gordonia sp. (in: high G+C Gram-positive bacteria)]|uniref:outer membrane protein assembly factor BamB family protein n=1 Tax=Gordonia sp. (in: high G+C Gram-positive bacteria) TaxID=84139 RepID=UPI0039E5DB5D